MCGSDVFDESINNVAGTFIPIVGVEGRPRRTVLIQRFYMFEKVESDLFAKNRIYGAGANLGRPHLGVRDAQ